MLSDILQVQNLLKDQKVVAFESVKQKLVEAQTKSNNYLTEEDAKFFTEIRDQLMEAKHLSPSQIINLMQNLCERDPEKSICVKFERWKTNASLFKRFLKLFPKLTTLPVNLWLSNVHINMIQRLYTQTFNRYAHFETKTSDFMLCDFEIQRISNDPYKIQKYKNCVNNYVSKIKKYDPTQLPKLRYKSLADLNEGTLKNIIDSGYNCFGVVLNTSLCVEDGSHWVCIYVDLKNQTVEFFNSTSGYDKELKLVFLFVDYLQDLLRSMGYGDVKKQVFQWEKIQTSNSACGPYCLMYILLRIIDINPEQIMQIFKDEFNQGDQLLANFRKLIFVKF